MESESKQVKQKLKKKLEIYDILKEAVIIFSTNINYIIFTFLTSLPLFCFMVYFETYLQGTLVETLKILNLSPVTFSSHAANPFFLMRRFSKDYFLELIQLGFMYLVPLFVLEFCSAVVSIDLASKLRSEEKKMTLKEMFQKPIDTSNLRGAFITCFYVLLLSSCHLLGLLWIVITYFVFLKNLSYYMLFAAICSMAFAKLLRLYLEWSAMWNMSVVISILEGIHGVEALSVSAYFNKGCQRRGLFLMLVFFACGQFLRLSGLHLGCYNGGNGIVIPVGLSCVINQLKWVVCMIYYYDCKDRTLEKKVDEEIGKDVEMVHE